MILRSSGSPPDQSIGRIDFPCKPPRGPQSGPLHYGRILIVLGFIALRPYVEDRLYSAASLPGCKPHRQRVGAFYHTVIGHDMAGPSQPEPLRSRPQPPARQAAGMYCRRPSPPLAPPTARPARIPQWSISRNRRANRATRPSAGSYGVTLPAPIMVGTSADLQVSQAVFTIGNPFGLDQTLTTGLASGRRCVATARVSHAPININPPGAGRSLGTRQRRRNEQCSLKLATWYNEYSISYRPYLQPR